MKRRRISAAFVELNSAEVIQSKDQQASLSEAGVLTSSQNQNRRSPQIASKTGATPEVKPTFDTKLSKDKNINIESRCGAFNTLQKADTSHLADIASNPRDIKHAILNQSQPKPTQTDKVGGVVNETDRQQSIQKPDSTPYGKPQCPGRTVTTHLISATTDLQEIPRKTNQSASMISKGGSSSLAQLNVSKGESKSLIASTQGHPESSRPRRYTRKSHVLQTKSNVDWSEDIRPTDEDEPVLDGAEGSGPFISSPSSGLVNQPEKPSKHRRKALKRKYTRSKASRVKKLKHEDNQLPLTTVQLGNFVIETRHRDAGETLPLVDPNAMDNHETTDIPENTLHAPEKQQLNKTDIHTNHQTQPETSGFQLDDRDRAMADTHTNEKMPPQDLPGGARGRGKEVGKKLTSALRGPRKRLSVSRARDVSPVSVTQASASRNTRGQMRQELGMEQAKDTTRKPFEQKIELTPSQLVPDTEISLRRTEVLEDAASTPIPNQDQKPSKSDRSTEQESSNDKATRYNEMPGRGSPLTIPSDIMVYSDHDASKEDGQHSESFNPETSFSSHISAGPRIHTHGASFLLVNGQTPESQRPLLAAQPCLTSLQGNTSSPARQWSMKRRCTVVDHNGSPLLKPHVNTSAGLIQSHPKLNSLSPVVGTSNSSSIYSGSSDDEESLEVFSLEHQPVAQSRPIWTKFQQDMLREYGIEAEQLFKRRTKSLFLSGSAKSDLHAKSVEDGQELGTQPARPQTPMNKATPSKTKMHSARQGESPERSQRASQRIGDELGQYSDQRKYIPALSAQYASRADPNSISSSLAQNGSVCMDWISALKTAQQTAHDQLLETNQVSEIYSEGVLVHLLMYDSLCRSSWLLSRKAFTRCYRSTDKDATACYGISFGHRNYEWGCIRNKWHQSKSSTQRSARISFGDCRNWIVSCSRDRKAEVSRYPIFPRP